MKTTEFARELGVSLYFVQSKVRTGEIPAKITCIGRKKNIDIDPALLPVWKEKIERKEVVFSSRNTKPRKKKSIYDTPLREDMKILIEYNKKHGTNLTYGDGVRLGIIKN